MILLVRLKRDVFGRLESLVLEALDLLLEDHLRLESGVNTRTLLNVNKMINSGKIEEEMTKFRRNLALLRKIESFQNSSKIPCKFGLVTLMAIMK